VATQREIHPDRLAERLLALPGFGAVRAAADRAGANAYLVGGAVRDALLGEPSANLDLVVDGEQGPLVAALGAEALIHDRFETAVVDLPSGPVDVARARAETYAYPGALPEVRPATVAEDLGRRDFTVNALAVPLADPGSLLDPLGGVGDLRAGLLRVLHERSFVDDPTRALRAARYGARLGLEPEPRTLELLRETDLGTVSRDRVAADVARLAAEALPRPGFELLDSWGLIRLAPDAGALIDAVTELMKRAPWQGVAARPQAVLAAVRGPTPVVNRLARAAPESPSAAVAAARGRSGVELALARAMGTEWLDDYVERWRDVRLAISGDDLIAAGVPEGPRVGRGLAAALRAKLDGEASGRDAELRVAVEAAGAPE
jgi:tRNA nucleotidyltransferase (CCA-adding enzyme)